MAVTVALLATVLGVCKVKDDNIVQAMQQAQADRLDHWNFYQARNIGQEVATASLAQLKLAAAAAPSQQAAYAAAIVAAERVVADQAQKKESCECRRRRISAATIGSTFVTISSTSRMR